MRIVDVFILIGIVAIMIMIQKHDDNYKKTIIPRDPKAQRIEAIANTAISQEERAKLIEKILSEE
jgi:hypothetical protein